jgi:hypothetical protein
VSKASGQSHQPSHRHLVGYTKDLTGNLAAGLYVPTAAALVSTLTALGCSLWMLRTTTGAVLQPAAE